MMKVIARTCVNDLMWFSLGVAMYGPREWALVAIVLWSFRFALDLNVRALPDFARGP